MNKRFNPRSEWKKVYNESPVMAIVSIVALALALGLSASFMSTIDRPSARTSLEARQ